MQLTRLGFSNFKAIGQGPVWLDWTKRVNVLIGANNAGKSSVLRALEVLSSFDWGKLSLDERDCHMRSRDNAFCVHLEGLAEDGDKIGLDPGETFAYVCQLSPDPAVEATLYDDWTLEVLRRRLRGIVDIRRTLGDQPSERSLTEWKRNWALQFVKTLLSQNKPKVHIIPAIRQIQGGSYDVSGRGVVELLASWQHPQMGRDSDLKKFDVLQKLLRRLLHTDDIRLEVPTERDEILVTNSGLRLGLRDYGTGIHELIILAIAVMSEENALFCIEEPEIHLHPVLQKELLDYLLAETSNRYVLTTHSQGFLRPGEQVAVQHLRSQGGTTVSRTVEATLDSLEVLADLGIRPSDLLQTNCVLWVEGPSDRHYLRRWLDIIAQEEKWGPLVEGSDYSIMFYGGALRSHLSMKRDINPEGEKLVELLRISQKSAIFMDSDKESPSASLDTTKRRVISECKEQKVLYVVTSGREIENDVGGGPIEAAYREKYDVQNGGQLVLGRFDRAEESIQKWLGQEWRPGMSYKDAKPMWSRLVAPHISSLPSNAALRNSLHEVAQMVDAARRSQ